MQAHSPLLENSPLGSFPASIAWDRGVVGEKHVEAIAHRDGPSQMPVVNVMLGPPTQLFVFGNQSGHLPSYRLVPNTCLLKDTEAD